MNIKVFTAFSGYDSQCLALKRLHERHPEFTYELVGWSEIDKDAITAHNALFPEAAEKNYGDISKIDWENVPDFDLFTMSSPCQDFSNAGLQRGGEEGSGTRSSLLWECTKAIRVKRPRYVILENVKHIVSLRFIDGFHRWQVRLEEMGYVNFTKIVNAKDFGVPQSRERLIMVSMLRTDGRDPSYHFPRAVPQTRCLADVLEGDADDNYFVSEDDLISFCRRSNDDENTRETNV